ncbi:MAG: hypothetical protein JJE30_16820 [Desulfuromonadales bacterium]|nr:hypothetical protein [Desulfuromonadales bacterium]
MGSAEFVAEIQERHLSSMEADRDLPSLRELTVRPTLDEIAKIVKRVFVDDADLVKKASIYMCHRYSGEKLKNIGAIFHLTESGVTRASQRFEMKVESDEGIRKMVTEIRNVLSIA